MTRRAAAAVIGVLAIAGIAAWTSAEPDPRMVLDASGNVLVPRGKLLNDLPPMPGKPAGSAAPEKPQVIIEDRAFLRNESKWPGTLLFVCWENPTPADDVDRALVRQAISETWERYSPMRFSGWEHPCSPESKAIRIRIADEGPVALALGRFIADIERDNLILNFTYHNWGSDCQDPIRRATCTYQIAVHEFGHALGFAHEQNRPDTPGECLQGPQGDMGNLTLTSWDPQSVMNYCNPEYLNAGRLSTGDICALQAFYGLPTDTQYVMECSKVLVVTNV